MLKIVIVDDNVKHLELIASYIHNYLPQSGIEGQIVLKTSNPEEAYDYVLNTRDNPNVFLIDIALNSRINGVELAYKIKQVLHKVYIIFITQHINYQQSAFRLHAFDFIPKPVTKKLLRKCLNDIFCELKEEQHGTGEFENNRLLIKSGYRELYLKKHEILYIEKQGNKALINTLTSQSICYLPLEHFERLFANDRNFLRCHKSFIVNQNYIREIRFNKLEIEMITGKICYLSRKYRRGFNL